MLNIFLCVFNLPSAPARTAELTYPIVGTGQTAAYDDQGVILKPTQGQPFYGQDANQRQNAPSYRDNKDGTVTDLVTGMTWMKSMGAKMTWSEAQSKLRELNLSTREDWRIPTIKELFSLALYSGRVFGPNVVRPFIDTQFFDQPKGDSEQGEREIDAQTWSSTDCKGKTMGRDQSRFGMNFVDGRIKAYPIRYPQTGASARMYFRFVRGNPAYGKNNFVDHHNGTISDRATGLMWQRADSGKGLDWKSALSYASAQRTAGFSDWRLPSVKELQSLVDYDISFQASGKPSLSSLFITSKITNPGGKPDVPYYWSSTTLLDGPEPGHQAAYVVFGTAIAKPFGKLVDAHGSGAVRSDPKSGPVTASPVFFGPQGDFQATYNYVRCVRTVARPAARRR